MKRYNNIFLILIVASLLLMGQTGCSTLPTIPTATPGSTQTGNTATVSTSASSQGLDFGLIPGVGMITNGAKLTEGDSFQVGVRVENYDSNPRSVTVCVKDDLEDTYGGVPTLCNPPVYVPGAQKDSSGKITTGKADTYFPSSSEYYKYHDFPKTTNEQTLNSQLTVTAQYDETSVISSGPNGVMVPEPQEENLQITQTPAPVSLSVENTISQRDNGYNVGLGITFNSPLSNAEIWTPGFKTKNGLQFDPKLGTFSMDCGLTSNIVNLEGNTKKITCSTIVPQTQTRYELIMNMNYGVKLNKPFAFIITVPALIKGGTTA